MIELGRSGRLKGAGFYEYPAGKRSGLWPGLRETFKSGSSEPPLQDMIDRMLFAEALETQKCLDEGVLTSTADANIGSIMGIGFRRGPVAAPIHRRLLRSGRHGQGGLRGAGARAGGQLRRPFPAAEVAAWLKPLARCVRSQPHPTRRSSVTFSGHGLYRAVPVPAGRNARLRVGCTKARNGPPSRRSRVLGGRFREADSELTQFCVEMRSQRGDHPVQQASQWGMLVEPDSYLSPLISENYLDCQAWH